MTQNEQILSRLRIGWLSPMECAVELGCLKLSTRVGELIAAGNSIESKWIEQNGKRFKIYRIAPPIVAKPATVIQERSWPTEWIDRLVGMNAS